MAFWSGLRSAIFGRGRPDLACGDCCKSERCALPPHADCVVKAMQLAERPNGPLPHDRFVRDWMGVAAAGSSRDAGK
jgi:hypothetical protein